MENTPLIGRYYIGIVIEITLSIAMTLITLKFFYAKSVSGYLPKWQRPLIYWLSKLVRVHRRGFQNKTTIKQLLTAVKSFDLGKDNFGKNLDSVEALSWKSKEHKLEQTTGQRSAESTNNEENIDTGARLSSLCVQLKVNTLRLSTTDHF